MDKEYLMLRSEIEENLKKQDQLFGTVISILGLTNVFSHISENVLFLFLILFYLHYCNYECWNIEI